MRDTVNFVSTPVAVPDEETVLPSISSPLATINMDDLRDVCTETSSNVEQLTLQPTPSLTSPSPSLVVPTDAEIQVREEELSTSNTDGNFEKNRLDPAKLSSLKLLLFSNFPVTCSIEKEKLWRSIKIKINAKCHASKFAKKRGHLELRNL